MKKIIFIMLITLVIVFILSRFAEIEKGNYEVIDSDFLAHSNSSNPMFWIDNHRILFFGAEGKKTRTISDKSKKKWGLFIWDTTTNKVQKYSDFRNTIRSLCYQDGYIYYLLQVYGGKGKGWPKTYVWKEGLIDDVTLNKISFDSSQDITNWSNSYTRSMSDCRLHARPAGLGNHIWAPLKKEDGYLDFGERQIYRNNNIALVKTNGERDVLPIISSHVSPFRLRYINHADAYFLPKAPASKTDKIRWKNDQCIPSWWIYRNGITKKYCIPPTKWNRNGSSRIYPTKIGMFVNTYDNRNTGELGISGGYVFSDKKVVKVTSGLLKDVSVSPDGCKVAFSYGENYDADTTHGKGKRTVKFVNLCK